MPTVLTLLGMRFYYWAREHEPIHIHVKKGNAEARFLIEPDIELTANKGFKPHELAIAEEVIRDNREYMIEHWKLFFKSTKTQ
ncbi:MAG: DUF4160 domain-containing protein [Chitinophagaceae bacterium]|jgi:hypothetical protein|nr:DUF4160 domain-containing protein [Chitinophagaceae bacterium]